MGMGIVRNQGREGNPIMYGNLAKRTPFWFVLTIAAATASLVSAGAATDDPPPDPCTVDQCVQGIYNSRPIQVAVPPAGATQVVSRVHKPTQTEPAYVWKTEPYVPYAAGPLAPAGQPLSISQAWWPWPMEAGDPGATLSSTYALPTVGVRANLSPYAMPRPGDFLSPSSTIGESSVALVPPGTGLLSTWWQGATRPTLERSVDLVTGVPLAEFSDLSLPFDGAEFRLKRTRSSESAIGSRRRSMWLGQSVHRDEWWDWVGAGWMSSENPILLIDACLPDVIGDGPKTTYLWLDAHHSIPFQQVFHPDHSHPAGGRIEYEAPPRFRARLRHNGIARFPLTNDSGWQSKINPDNQIGWRIPPSQFEIWLYDGAVKYTFVAMYDIVPRNDGSQRFDAKGSLPPIRFNTKYLENGTAEDHIDPVTGIPTANWVWLDYNARPFTRQQFIKALQGTEDVENDPRWHHNEWDFTGKQPGHGLPHHGICVKIESPQGHTVDITHAPVTRTNYNTGLCGLITSPEDSPSKGAVRYIKLKSGSAVHWTLLYTYRRSRGMSNDQLPELCDNTIDIRTLYPEANHKRLYQSAGHMFIDRIYVFEGDVQDAVLEQFNADIEHPAIADATTANPNPDLKLNQIPLALTPLGEDPVDVMIQVNGIGGSKGWSYKIQYYYKTESFQHNDATGSGVSMMPLLVQSTVTTRSQVSTSLNTTSTPRESQRRTIFAYSQIPEPWPVASDLHSYGLRSAWLSAIFTEADISNAIEHCSTKIGSSSFLYELKEQELREWARPIGQQASQTIADWAAIEGEESETLLRFASTRWNTIEGVSWPANGTESPQSPTLDSLRSGVYLRTDAQGFYNHNIVGGTASTLRMRRGQAERVYRFNRLLVIPNGAHADNPLDLKWSDPTAPRLSIYAHPYRWQASLGYYNVSGIIADYTNAYLSSSYGSSPDLTKARWITIIDEMPSAIFDANGNVIYNEAFENYNSNGVKQGQISRRVVEMNAAGYVLRDRRWDFASDSAGQTVVSGGGLGEQFVYAKAENLGIQGLPVEPVGPQGGGSTPELIEKTNAIRLLRNEVLLVEKRSVGWSAGESAVTLDPSTQSATWPDGLVHFFEYRFVPDDKRAAGGFLEAHGRGIQIGAQELSGVPQPVS